MLRVSNALRRQLQKPDAQLAVALRVEGSSELATVVLKQVANELGSAGVKFTSLPISVPTGAAMFIDGAGVEPSVIGRLPDIVRQALQQVGVNDAMLELARQEGPALLSLGEGLSLRAYPTGDYLDLRGDDWIDLAWEWLRRCLRERARLFVYGNVPLPVALEGPRDADNFRHLVVAGDRHSMFVTELVNGRRAAAAFHWGRSPNIVLLQAGDVEANLEAATELRNIARGVAGNLNYAYIDQMGFALALSPMSRAGPGSTPEGWFARAPMLFVLDAFPYQVLGPTHVRRLGAPPAGALLLEKGRHELDLSSGAWWRTSQERARMMAKGRSLLGPCIGTVDDVREALRQLPTD